MSWSARQYTKFEHERNRPIHDLLAQIHSLPVANAIDIGCGPGNSTELLQARFAQATIIGMDSDADMIAAARKRLPAIPFELADIATWQPEAAYDVILSNAVLQWLPKHETLMPSLVGKLTPGGSLAVQMPDNLDEPAHVLMREIAADGPWAGKLAKAAGSRAPRHHADWYYRVLRDSAASIDIWRTTYHHVLEGGAGAIVEWFKGSGLRPFLAPLDEAEREAFLARYQDAVARAYPAMPDGTVLLPFPRLFFVATR
ncbi:trans-aconitate 2-methyltransferase [Bosea sp. BK604]|uniref:trans-aconitate 2-methyltransferase n=1 Tax=Bosea sp. BK604 TaxID=2512180 RepID=UPI001045ECF4|nr:trans-aconitate 2-methyltransferase [Bosea sp. BK604]TCR64067.1 trans-aconitate 2-methyltransferase [Bosea sp. BK604]